MRADPVGQRLRPARLGIGVAGGAHHRDEDLGLPDLAAAAVDQLDGLPGIVDKHALAGRMRLAHRRRQPALPGAVQLAPAAVAVAVGFGLPVFLPQQHQGDTGPAQLVVDMGPIRLGLATRSLGTAGAGIQHRLQRPVAQCRRQRPAKLRGGNPLEGERDGAARHPDRARNGSLGGAAFVLEAQNLAYPSHRHSLGWHRLPRSSRSRRAQSRPAQRSSDHHPPGWPTSNRNGRD